MSRDRRRGGAIGLVVAILAVATAALLFVLVMKPAAEKPRVASRFAGDWKLLDVRTKQPFSLASLKGKVIVVNIWATWCKPCVEELPTFQRLYDKLKGDSAYAFAFVSFDESIDAVESFLARTGYNLPVYMKAEPPPPLFEPTEGIPRTMFIAKDGRIAKSDTGYAEWDARWVVDDLKRLADE